MKRPLIALTLILTASTACSVVEPGERGLLVTFGQVNTQVQKEGLIWHSPWTHLESLSIKQHTQEITAECYSSDLQQVTAKLKVLYRLPEDQVYTIFMKYAGDPFESLVVPRVNEALKEQTAKLTAEQVVKSREQVKVETLRTTREKVGNVVQIDDIVIENLDLTKQLEEAIEDKMVQQQQAAKAEFTMQKAKVDAETAVITAKGEADAMKVQGAALRDNPKLIDYQIAQKWNGVSPLVVSDNASNILLPLHNEQQ